MSWVHGTSKRHPAKKKAGTTHKRAPGAHRLSRRGSPIAPAAKIDPWKHKAQAKRQG